MQQQQQPQQQPLRRVVMLEDSEALHLQEHQQQHNQRDADGAPRRRRRRIGAKGATFSSFAVDSAAAPLEFKTRVGNAFGDMAASMPHLREFNELLAARQRTPDLGSLQPVRVVELARRLLPRKDHPEHKLQQIDYYRRICDAALAVHDLRRRLGENMAWQSHACSLHGCSPKRFDSLRQACLTAFGPEETHSIWYRVHSSIERSVLDAVHVCIYGKVHICDRDMCRSRRYDSGSNSSSAAKAAAQTVSSSTAVSVSAEQAKQDDKLKRTFVAKRDDGSKMLVCSLTGYQSEALSSYTNNPTFDYRSGMKRGRDSLISDSVGDSSATREDASSGDAGADREDGDDENAAAAEEEDDDGGCGGMVDADDADNEDDLDADVLHDPHVMMEDEEGDAPLAAAAADSFAHEEGEQEQEAAPARAKSVADGGDGGWSDDDEDSEAKALESEMARHARMMKLASSRAAKAAGMAASGRSRGGAERSRDPTAGQKLPSANDFAVSVLLRFVEQHLAALRRALLGLVHKEQQQQQQQEQGPAPLSVAIKREDAAVAPPAPPAASATPEYSAQDSALFGSKTAATAAGTAVQAARKQEDADRRDAVVATAAEDVAAGVLSRKRKRKAADATESAVSAVTAQRSKRKKKKKKKRASDARKEFELASDSHHGATPAEDAAANQHQHQHQLAMPAIGEEDRAQYDAFARGFMRTENSAEHQRLYRQFDRVHRLVCGVVHLLRPGETVESMLLRDATTPASDYDQQQQQQQQDAGIVIVPSLEAVPEYVPYLAFLDMEPVRSVIARESGFEFVPKQPDAWAETRVRWELADRGRQKLLLDANGPAVMLQQLQQPPQALCAQESALARQERMAEHQRFFFEAFKVAKMLCPGLHRLKLELGSIVEQCKDKNRRLRMLLKECHATGAVPSRENTGDMRELLSFDAYNYHALDLTSEFTDQEALRCVDLMHHLWELCRASPYVRVNGPQCLVMRNHCLAVLYAMVRGMVIAGRVVIPPNPKFSKRGFLVGLNSINKYEFKRTQYSTGTNVLKQCLYSLVQILPVHSLLYHHAMEAAASAQRAILE
jgi:hypothetical protein